MTNQQDYALTGYFIMEGVRDVGHLNGLTPHLCYEELLGLWDQGAVEMGIHLTQYAEHIIKCRDAHADQDFPGVFDYEVTSEFGTWMARYLAEYGDFPSHEETLAWIEDAVDEFFKQGSAEYAESKHHAKVGTVDDLVPVDTPIFIASENPECCRKCGSRTVTMTSRLPPPTTLEKCPNCGFKYILEQPEEGED